MEPERFSRIIDAAILDDCINIICNPNLFRRHFREAFKTAFPVGDSRDETRIFLKRLIKPRNLLYHANPISVRQAEQVICYSHDIIESLKKYYEELKPWLPVYEGFLTYGGMSTKEVEAMAVGIREMTDLNVAGSAAEFVKYFAERLIDYKIPVVTPPGGLACHVDAKLFLPHILIKDMRPKVYLCRQFFFLGCRIYNSLFHNPEFTTRFGASP